LAQSVVILRVQRPAGLLLREHDKGGANQHTVLSC
jgi:hypothetical protein